MYCSARPPPANIALNAAPTCRRQHSIKAATHPTPIRTGKIERGGGGNTVLVAHAPIFFYIKNKNDVKSFHLDREESFRYHVFPVKIAIGGGIGPCGTCPKKSPHFFPVQKKYYYYHACPHEFSDLPLSLPMQRYISHNVVIYDPLLH